MIEVTLKSNPVEKRLADIQMRLNNIPITKVAEEVRSSIEINLNAPRSDDGSGLKPLSKKYKDWKVKHGFPTNIFQQTGLLVRSIKKKKMGKNWYRVYVDPKRENVMYWLNENGRKAFGLDRSRKNIKEMLPQILKDLIG